MNERVLIVEDDASVGDLTALVLEHAGFRTDAAGSGPDAVEMIRRAEPDAVVLDVMLPGLDGFEVCRQVRHTSRVPIVMVTARSDVTDVVVGLELGADDYLRKPFEPAELVARVRAVLRRPSTDPDAPVLRVGGLVVDLAAFEANRDGTRLDLSPMEFRLLAELVRSAGQVLTREVLLDRVWGYDYLGDSRLVDMAITRLRSKLGDDPRRPRYITTLRGVGYRFERP